jgi:RNA polymerase sigma factor (sigma-70 family)
MDGIKVSSMSPVSPIGADLPTAAMGFHTTHWTVVLTARAKDSTAAREALASLCSTYWYPLYAFIRRQGFSPHDAEDLTQEFFFRFLERHALGSVQPACGKFRSFLLVCLKNFLGNERERAQAQRRGGGRPLVPLDSSDAETRYTLEPADNRTPEAVFERRWAFAVLEQTMAELQREHAAGEKRDLFEALQGFLPGGQGSVSKTELAAKRGISVGAIDVAVHRLRQRFGALLREQVAQTVSSEAEVEEEIRHLISVLSA